MKKRILLLLLVLSVTILSGCSHIEDTNGDDTTLETIDMEKLSGTSISATTSGVSTQSVRNNITLVDMHEDIDLDAVEMTGGTTSGITNLLATEVKGGETLGIYVESSVDSGNLQIILLSEDNEVIYEFETGSEDIAEISPDDTTVFFVRSGMESYSGTIYIERIIE